MKSIYCIALEGESLTGSLWFHTEALRAAALGTTGADKEVCFTVRVAADATDLMITTLVDAIETAGGYGPEAGLNENEQNILKVLRDERDEWAKAHEQLIEQVQWARSRHQTKLADSLRHAREHADTMQQAASDMYDNVYAILHPDG